MRHAITFGTCITCLHSKAAVVTKCVINLLAPILQAYQHQFASFSLFCKRFEDEN